MNLNNNVKGGTFCLSKAGLAIGNPTSRITIAAPNGAGVDFCIDGKLYHKADTANITISVTDQDGTAVTTQAADTACLYLVQLNSSGTVTLIKGTDSAVDSSGNLESGKSLRYPVPSADNCPIGAVKVVTDGVTFAAGTDGLDKSGVTDTYIDLFSIPGKTET